MKYLSKVYGEGGIEAHCVAASESPEGIKIYTIETKAPKFINAEINTHRMLSRNFASSRAIPFRPLDEIYLPFDVRKNQKGMQGYEKLGIEELKYFQADIKDLYEKIYEELTEESWNYPNWSKVIHKQHLNRYLEPFMFQRGVITATEWDNFFKLRLAPDTQPEMQELARCIKEAQERSEVTRLNLGEWHLPYALPSDTSSEALRSSVAGCCRVSYGVVGGTEKRTLESDLELAERLLKSGHWSAFEHQASPLIKGFHSFGTPTHLDIKGRQWSGNFRGFSQYRQTLQDWN